MGIRITDCTIRDGGYLLQKNSDPTFVKGILKGLVDAGIDFVETGFLQTKVTGETLVYANSVDARRYMPSDRGRTNFLGFCDNSRYRIIDLDPYDGKSFKWLRISFAKYEIDDSLAFCREAQKLGYTVQFNPMDALSYTDDERVELITKVNKLKPGSLSIVDTFGAMYIEDLEHIFCQMDDLLDRNIAIGLHSHDNLGLSTALAETIIKLSSKTERDVIVDGSLYGMGRGAGNAKTELLADYINKYHMGDYDVKKLIETIDQYIIPLLSRVSWGYDLPMYICGTERSHVDNVYHLMNKYNSKTGEMLDVIKLLPKEQRTRYMKGYSKTDFHALDKVYQDYVERRI
jgi:4-hydroxy 2-oxovalerate aldolase